ncbi:hypothetical protein ACTXT7_013656, partial [Hymenolepis weldensis]
GLRVNADADADTDVDADSDAYVEILQTIVVKPSWIDSVATNGGRLPPPPPPHIFQQNSPPSHKALKTQDFMRRTGWGVVEQDVNKRLHNTKSSSLMEAMVEARAMVDINKDHLI